MQSELDDKDDDVANVAKNLSEVANKATDSIKKLSNALAAISTEVCPECGEPIVHIGGCVQCPNCSWSRCE